MWKHIILVVSWWTFGCFPLLGFLFVCWGWEWRCTEWAQLLKLGGDKNSISSDCLFWALLLGMLCIWHLPSMAAMCAPLCDQL